LCKAPKNSINIDIASISINLFLETGALFTITHYRGAALEIDHPEGKTVIEKMDDRWMEYQYSLHPKGRNLRPDMDKKRKEE